MEKGNINNTPCNNENKMEEIALGEKIRPTSVNRSSSAKSMQLSNSNGTTLDDYDVLSTIGTGSYGTCKKIRRKRDGKILVWKELDYGTMSEAEKQLLVSEVNLLRELKSPYIVRYYDRIIDRAHTTIYIIMEYCRGGDLSTIIANCKVQGNYLDEDLIWKILVQLTLALHECHQRKNGRAVLHRDMKPANVFLDMDKNVKLGDFGLARVLHHETSFANTYVGTPYYMSPELVNNMAYNEKSDIWSMGCVLYELCALRPPFIASGQSELNKKIRLGEFSRIPAVFSDDLNTVITRLLHVEVSKRPSIAEVLEDLVVANHRVKLESKLSLQPHGSSDLKSWEKELRKLERELDEKKQELDKREKELKIREKLVEDKDKSATVREKRAEEKLSRAESLMHEYERRVHLNLDKILHRDMDLASNPDSLGDGLASCLMRKKDEDIPKKKVSFDMYGKENQRFMDRFRDPLAKYSDYDSSYIQELVKRQELKERLYKVTHRTMELTDDTTVRSRNLLLFR